MTDLEDGFYVLFTFTATVGRTGKRWDTEYLVHGPIETRALANKYKKSLENKVRTRSMNSYTVSGRVLDKAKMETFIKTNQNKGRDRAHDLTMREADPYTLMNFESKEIEGFALIEELTKSED